MGKKIIMKKIFSILISFVIIFSMAMPSFAAEEDFGAQGLYFNEYDYILTLQQSTPGELEEMGLTEVEANEIVANFENELAKRAALPDEVLVGYGYEKNEIDALHAYNSNVISKSSNILENDKTVMQAFPIEMMRAITGTCTGKITASYCSTKKVVFKYSWSWDHAPVMQLKDSAAVRWLAYDSKGHEIDVTKTSDSRTINYYWNGSKRFEKSGKKEADLEFNSINIRFKMSETFQSGTTMTESAYAKSGNINISVAVEEGVNNSIKYIKVAGLYGHTTLGANFPSISLSPVGSISIGFSGNTSITSIASAKVKISKGSSNSSPTVTKI